MALNCSSLAAKCRTALLITTSAKPSGQAIASMGSTQKFVRGRWGATVAASACTVAIASALASLANTS